MSTMWVGGAAVAYLFIAVWALLVNRRATKDIDKVGSWIFMVVNSFACGMFVVLTINGFR